ncbi:unnamed protein product [Moneuplotes crassus]|uniref:Uncharacterized protein n=1 Tax=Euplotes crassus TaxID=5936 RepID=A0AAD2D5Q9_EUPCR|nr:unnamed protein product [Moneuplotes crassus]
MGYPTFFYTCSLAGINYVFRSDRAHREKDIDEVIPFRFVQSKSKKICLTECLNTNFVCCLNLSYNLFVF